MSYFRQYCKYLEPLENILVLYNILYKIYIYIYIYIIQGIFNDTAHYDDVYAKIVPKIGLFNI